MYKIWAKTTSKLCVAHRTSLFVIGNQKISNLDPEAGYLDGILRLSVGPPDKFRINLLEQVITASFQILSNPIFTNYPTSFCSWENEAK
jgi:hypothetical protein